MGSINEHIVSHLGNDTLEYRGVRFYRRRDRRAGRYGAYFLPAAPYNGWGWGFLREHDVTRAIDRRIQGLPEGPST